MKLRILMLGCAISVLACSTREPTAVEDRPLLNGDDLTDVESIASTAVSVRYHSDAGSFGVGVLIAPRVVLTAQHVVLTTKGERIPASDIFVAHGNDKVELTAEAADVKTHPGMEYDGQRRAVDLALIFLDSDFSPPVPIPELDCDEVLPLELTCSSSTKHIDLGKNTEAAIGLVSTATFEFTDIDIDGSHPPESTPWSFRYGPTKRRFAPDQAVGTHGDSGMGCVDSSTGKLSFITTDGQPVITKMADPKTGLPPEIIPTRTIGVGTQIGRHCGWIKKMVEQQKKLTFFQHIDADSKRDSVAVAQINGSDFSLEIERTSLGSQSFGVSLPSDMDLRAGALGNFTGSGQSLVVAGDVGLLAAAFDGGGVAPSLPNVSNATYVALSKMRIDAGKVDDLVAQRADRQIDVFLGGASGLQLQPAAHPIALRLDNDELDDFLWVDGGPTIHWSTSLFGPLAKDVVPNTLHLDMVKSGRFRRLHGANAGIDDIVAVGDGTVIWCSSTTFGAIECKPALDAPFIAPHRDARDVTVGDLNSDGIDDLTVAYSNAPPRVFLGKPAGFQPGFGHKVRAVLPADVNGDDSLDSVALDDPDGNVSVSVRLGKDGGEFGPFITGIPFAEPFAVAVGNLNDDGLEDASVALEEGFIPLQDLVVLSGGRVFVLMSNGDGSLDVEPLDGQDGFVDIDVGDTNGDGIDDVEATRDDGSVTTYVGALDGVHESGENFTGLPTPNGNDGKMLLLSGLGVDTVGTSQMRMRLRVGAGDTAALSRLKVQIFDGDNGGFHQFDEATHLLKTCYRLSADPCGDGNSGNCAGGPITPTPLTTVSSDALGDDKWDTIFDGPHSPQASLTGDGLPPFTYELRVYLASDCASPPAAGSQLSVATADAFKVRSNALLSQPLGEFSIVGSDAAGPFGVSSLPYMRDTAYDGTFSLPIAVGSSAAEIQLKEADADDLDDAAPGVSLGANHDIRYRLLKPDGTSASLVGDEDTVGATLVANPSGNNDGQTALDVETRIHSITGSGAGTWTWRWENVMATNAIHLFTPFGSPTTHEVLGARRVRPAISTAQQPAYWRSAAGELAGAFPLVLGHGVAGEQLEGNSLVVPDLASAISVLDNLRADLHGELERQLLTAKLNWLRGLTLGEDIKGALVYGRTKQVRSVFEQADDAVANVDGLATDARVRDLVTLLSSINLGELNYQQPGVPFPEEPMVDDDGDGVVNMKDNCPSIANPLQEDADDDWIGDACHVSPVGVCVLSRSEADREAVFGYENPLSFRGLPQGTRNALASNGEVLFESVQPTELLGGARFDAFRYPLGRGETLSWTLDGETALVDDRTRSCSGRELTHVPLVPQAALYGAESLVIGERASVRGPGGTTASIASGGDVVVEAASVVGNVFAAGRAAVGERGAVRGVLATAGGFEQAPSAQIEESHRFAARSYSLAWWVDFAARDLRDVVVGGGRQDELEPGDYGDVLVSARGQLRLLPGRYRFRSLRVQTEASLRLGEGETVIHVQQRLEHAGDTRLNDSTRLVLGYLGTAPAFVDASLTGVVVAPNAELTLGGVRQSAYVGSFAARRMVVRPETQVEFSGFE